MVPVTVVPAGTVRSPVAMLAALARQHAGRKGDPLR
jgi:hypothetical protein